MLSMVSILFISGQNTQAELARGKLQFSSFCWFVNYAGDPNPKSALGIDQKEIRMFFCNLDNLIDFCSFLSD